MAVWSEIPAEMEDTETTLQKRSRLIPYIKYGQFLNQAFSQHALEKDAGKTDITWEKWLKENVGTLPPQERKISTGTTELLSPYPRFKKLGLSFFEWLWPPK